MSTLPQAALIFHQTSTAVVVGLFQNGLIIAQPVIAYRDASKELIPSLDSLLKEQAMSLSDISYIGCSIGPAPFTTLRTLVVTVNGLGFAAGIPLVGVNGLLCLAQERHTPLYQRTYALNNAFGSEVYYAVYDPAHHYAHCQVLSCNDAVDSIASYGSQHPDAKIQIVGSALALYSKDLYERGIAFDCPENSTSYASIEAIAATAFHGWSAGQAVSELKPYYGKTAF